MEKQTIEFYDDTDESEDELELSLTNISEAVIFNTDWTIETIISQLTQKNIDMPVFQRRDAWSKAKKSRYIESLILGLPVPQIILAEMKNNRGKYLVLDGKQRLLSILQFTGNDPESSNNAFKLQGLEILKKITIKGKDLSLSGKTLNDIKDESDLKDLLAPFYNQTVHAILIRNWPNTSFLHSLFVRLNTNTLPLSPQELRQALFPGKFVKYADEASRNSKAIKKLLDLETDEIDLRMRDIELLVRYLAFSFYLPEHPGSLKKFLDVTCEELNKHWSEKEEAIKKQVQIFEQAVQASIDIFKLENVARRWTSEGYSTRLNKAVLDILTFYFSDEKIRAVAISKAKKVESAFKQLCLENEDFRKSVETTTKSLVATSTRLILWGKTLQEVTGLDFKLPQYSDENNRIKFTKFW